MAILALPVASASATTKDVSSQTSVISNAIAVGTSVNDSVTLTVQVIVSGSVTGNQYVYFYDGPYHGTGQAPPLLGSAKLYSSTSGSNQTACTTNSGSNKAICTATLVLSGANAGLSSGYNLVEAYYPGDNFVLKSWDAVNLYSGTDNYCQTGSANCQATGTGNLASATFTGGSPLSGTEDVVLAFAPQSDGTQLTGCSLAQSSDVVAWNLTNAGSGSELSYTILGQDAAAAETAAPTTSFPMIPGHVCFESSQPFTAWSSTGPISSTQETDEDQNPVSLFYGQLGPCSAYAIPCVVSVSYTKAAGPHPARYTQVFDTNTTDPRVSW
ncbi:MAG TPA: hypothetical protein VG321_07335 [Solirubrobacteraceae bacterium]|jgi:hypothetical protein|nr:hypothetical protein [Solirubrobacteraceae bacterium]